ncbi:hypothetical protein [Streptomyces sp. NPDC000410]|uniref:hypothetical protein n=1 Tax=Streptomyces sp. NPDC000410 TaxID=3154254 RepID=UPI003330D1CF
MPTTVSGTTDTTDAITKSHWRTVGASRVSAAQEVRAFTHPGITVDHLVRPGTVSAAEFAARIDACTADEATRAVVVQFPPPARLTSLVQRLDPAKDIDGLPEDFSLQRACVAADGISRIVEAFDTNATVAVAGARVRRPRSGPPPDRPGDSRGATRSGRPT